MRANRTFRTSEPKARSPNGRRAGGPSRTAPRAAAAVATSAACLAGVAGVTLVAQPARAQQSLYWDVNGDAPGPGGPLINGTWSSTAFSWSADPAGETMTFPWGNGSTAVFTAGSYPAGYNVFIMGFVHVGGIEFQDGSATINGGALILTGAGGIINTTAPSARMNVIVDGTVGLTKNGAGTLTLAGPLNYSGDTAVNAGTLRLEDWDLTASSALHVAAGAKFELISPFGESVIRTAAVSVAGSGKIDIADNKLITDTPAGTASGVAYSGVQGYVQQAHNGGAWNGSGITTSMPDALTGLTSMGVATGAQMGVAAGQTDTFAGQTITDTSTIAMYTYKGDANLDGFISADDYTAIDFAVAQPGASGWVNGDFNWDGFISADDYTAIDFNLIAQGAPFSTGGASASAAPLSPVPEPAAAWLLAPLLVMHARRRRGGRGIRMTSR